MSSYLSYSPNRAASVIYRTRTPPKYVEHRDAIYNSTLSPYITPRDSVARIREEVELAENLSASKIRVDNQVRDIRLQLDNKYSVETIVYRNKWQESESRRSFLESENSRLALEISEWKKRSSASDIERSAHFLASESLRAEELIASRAIIQSRNLDLTLEAERLRDLLLQKVEECNEIRANYSKLEILNADNLDKDKAALDYESKISALKSNYGDKLREVETLKQQKVKLELDSIELQQLQREADQLRAILDSKRDENSRIRREKTEIEVENYKSKKAETALLEKEALLKSQVNELESHANQAEDLRKSTYLEKRQSLAAQQDDLRRSLHQEKTVLEQEIEDRQQQVSEKLNLEGNLRKSYHELNSDLSNVSKQASSAEVELQIWKSRTSQADRLKEEEIARANRLKELAIQQAEIEARKEKQSLEERANLLGEIVTHKTQNLSKVLEESSLTEAEKRVLEEEKAILQIQVEDLLRKLQDNDFKFQSILNSTDNIHSSQIDRLRKDHESERRRINGQIDALRNVIDSKSIEAENAKREASRFSLKLLTCESQAKNAEIDSQYWRDRALRIAREKEVETNIQRELTVSQLRDLERQQSIEKLQKQREGNVIRSLIDSKNVETSELRLSQVRTASVLARERQDKVKLEAEAQLSRSRALEAERAKYEALRLKESVNSEVLDSLRRSRLASSQILRNEVSQLSESLLLKEREARDWKSNYAHLATSPYRKY